MNKLLIGISGKIGTGKSALAKLLCEQLGATKLSFGDEVKKETSEIFKIPLEDFYDNKEKKVQVSYSEWTTIRELMQWWGTDFRRFQNPNYWIDKLFSRMELSSTSHFIIDDVRFLNEFEAIQKKNGTLIRLEPYKGYVSSVGSEHGSETELDDTEKFDLVFKPLYGDLGTVAYVIGRYFKMLPEWKEEYFGMELCTCNTCIDNLDCGYVFDLYNYNGDCLGIK